jgi:hypothetical protein
MHYLLHVLPWWPCNAARGTARQKTVVALAAVKCSLAEFGAAPASNY